MNNNNDNKTRLGSSQIFENCIKKLPPTLSSQEVCEVLKISQSTLKRYRAKGYLQPIKVGQGKRSRVLYLTEPIFDLLERSKQI